jgi:hypothetical protein
MEAKKMHANALPSAPTLRHSKEEGHIKVVESDESAAQYLQNVTEIDGGILEYVREQMHCKTVTREVRRQAALFQNEMDRMQGW